MCASNGKEKYKDIEENVVEARDWRADGTFWVMSFVFILVAMGAFWGL